MQLAISQSKKTLFDGNVNGVNIKIVCKNGKLQGFNKDLNQELAINGINTTVRNENDLDKARKSLVNGTIQVLEGAIQVSPKIERVARVSFFFKELEEGLTDPVTEEVIRNPAKLPCGHVVDKSLISRMNGQCPSGHGCPPFADNELQDDPLTQLKLDLLHAWKGSNPKERVVMPKKLSNEGFVGNNSDANSLFNLITSAMQRQDFDAAMTHFDELGKCSSSVEHFAIQPIIFMGLASQVSEVEHKNEYLESAMWAYVYLGKLQAKLGDKEGATEAFSLARDLGHQLGILFDNQELLKDYQELLVEIGERSKAVIILHELASLNTNKNEYEQAEAYLKEACQLQPDELEVYECLAEFYCKRDQIPDACATYWRAGDYFKGLKKLPTAQGLYQKAVERSPTDISANIRLSTFYQDQNNLRAALQVYRSALSVLVENKQPAEAKKYYDAFNALWAESESEKQDLLGLKKQVLADYSKLSLTESERFDIDLELGSIAVQLEQYDLAAKCFFEAARQPGISRDQTKAAYSELISIRTNTKLFCLVAQAYRKLAGIEKAEKSAEAHDDLLTWLVDFAEGLSNEDLAEQNEELAATLSFSLLGKRESNGSTYLRSARLLKQLGTDTDKTMQAFRAAVEANPMLIGAHDELFNFYIEKNQPEEAAKLMFGLCKRLFENNMFSESLKAYNQLDSIRNLDKSVLPSGEFAEYLKLVPILKGHVALTEKVERLTTAQNLV
ncbi:MAG: hypothetical protein H7A40_07510 [Chlamydiales bacterium]|nr:hypothetical protein [Chlamydiales bacterium]